MIRKIKNKTRKQEKRKEKKKKERKQRTHIIPTVAVTLSIGSIDGSF